jgi:hypothetical protein
VDKDVFPGRALNKAIPFGSVEPLDCSLFFHKCNSFRLSSEIGNLLQESAWWRKGCCFAGQSSFPQQMAAVPEGPHYRQTPATGWFGEVQLLYKNINPNAPREDDRRELGIIFRNSGFCKAICFTRFCLAARTPK